MKSSETRTELFAFWYWIEWMSLPSRSMSKPASRRTRALLSSFALHQTNSSMSGWSTSRMTIFAARRVLPPDLIVPADASAPRMKLTGPDAVPPPASSSWLARILREVDPGAGAALEDRALLGVPVEDRVHRVVDDRMKQALACWGTPFTPMLNHTGELNAAFWWTMRCFSSARNVAASSSSTK